MDDKKADKPADPKDQNSEMQPNADSGEYGIEQILAPTAEKLEEARKHSFYHYSRSELEHKSDPIEESNESNQSST
ncbi:MAG TPA: hypothetical protein V6C72_15710 [Chroococcales cyanobacterium]